MPRAAPGSHWIAGAIKHPGALHRQMHVPAGSPIPAGRLAAAAKKGGKLGKRARLAQVLKGMHHGKNSTSSHQGRLNERAGAKLYPRKAGS